MSLRLTWRGALLSGAVIETLIVVALALYVLGVVPADLFGGVRPQVAAVALHHPSSVLIAPIFSTSFALGLGSLQSLVAAAVIVGAAQAVVIGALVFGCGRYPRIAAGLALTTVAVVALHNRSPYPDGMDSNRDGVMSMEEWTSFHAAHPKLYGGYDGSGYIREGSPDYYEREFMRVDCDRDLKMDSYEYGELRWNMRWCGSSLRPPRPWWK